MTSKTKRSAAPRLQGRRFSEEQRRQALTLIAAGVDRGDIATKIGTTTGSLRRRVQEATMKGTMPAAPAPSTRGCRLARPR